MSTQTDTKTPDGQVAVVTPAETKIAKTGSPAVRGWSLSQAEHERTVRERVPEELQEDVIWLGAFLSGRCKNSKEELARICKDVGKPKGTDYLYQLLTGFYFHHNKNLGRVAFNNVHELVADLKDWDRKKSKSGRMTFAETSIYEGIREYIMGKRVPDTICKWGAIIGHNGLGKSVALEKYRDDNNHRQTIYVEAPTVRSVMDLQLKIGREYNIIKPSYTRRELENALLDNITESKAILIDNAQRLYSDANGFDQACLAWLQEIQDETKCTIILSWTPVSDFHAAMLKAGEGDDSEMYLWQFVGRVGGLDRFHILPEHAPVDDIRLIAESFKLRAGLWKEHKEKFVKLARGHIRLRPFAQMLQDARRRATLDECAMIEEKHLVWPQAL